MRTFTLLVALACRGADATDPPTTASSDVPPRETGPPDVVEPCVAPRVQFNEIVASSIDGPLDGDGDSPDWIELFNATGGPIDLVGWWLNDGDTYWELPTLNLVAGGHRLVFASGKDRGAGIHTWDTKVDSGHLWQYREVTGPFEPDWFEVGFDDSAWATGPSGFGRADGDDATHIEANRAQIRTTFSVSPDELDDVVEATLHVDFDDGFIAWLNGVEVARANLAGPGEPPWDAFAESPHEAQLQQGNPPVRYPIDPELLRGDNTLALTVADFSASSTDLTLIPFVSLGYGHERPSHSTTAFDLTGGDLHTSFELRAEGETIRLLDPSGCPADVVEMGQQWADMSYGRVADGSEDFGYFAEPTPGGSNVTESRPGFAQTPELSPGSGFYPGGVTVEVSGMAGARLVVATGGVEPRESDPDHSGSVVVDGSSDAEVLRARAFEDGRWPSRIATATYFGGPAPSVAVISLVTDPPNLWDWDTGIYTMGDGADPEPPHYGANFWQDWEKPVHATMWEPNGTLAFAVDGGVEIFGGNSRARPQKSLKLKMRGGYGAAAVNYPVFPELPITEYESLVFRTSGSDWFGCTEFRCYFGSMFRDAMMQRITDGVDLDRMAYRPAVLYLNGEFWGIQNIRERAHPSWVAAHHGVEDMDFIERRRMLAAGTNEHFDQLMQYLRDNDLSDPVAYATVQTMMDVDQFATYQAVQIWFDNKDWPGNNIRYWRPRTADGRWRWLLYDLDFGVGLWNEPVDNDKLFVALQPDSPGWPNPPEATELFRLMMSAPDFRVIFLNRYADLMNTLLLPSRTQAMLAEMAAVIEPVMPDHLQRWGTWTDGETTRSVDQSAWEATLVYQHDWLAARSDWARLNVIDNLGLTGTWTLQLDAEPPGAGQFELAAVTVDGPFAGTYFEGIPVTITAVPGPGRTFVEWSDSSLPAAPTITVNGAELVDLTAVFR